VASSYHELEVADVVRAPDVVGYAGDQVAAGGQASSTA
jgi:hypothetical protein